MLKTPLTLAFSVIGVPLPPALFFRVQPRSFSANPLPLPPAPHLSSSSSAGELHCPARSRSSPAGSSKPPVSLHVLLTIPSLGLLFTQLVPLLSPLAAPRKAEGFPHLCLEKRQAVTRGLLPSFPFLLLLSSSTTSHHLPIPRPRPPSSSSSPIASSSKASHTSYPALLHPLTTTSLPLTKPLSSFECLVSRRLRSTPTTCEWFMTVFSRPSILC